MYKRCWDVQLRASFWYVGFCSLFGQINYKGISLELLLQMLVRHGLLTASSELCCLPGGGMTRQLAWGHSP